MTSSHFIFIPLVAIAGMVLGFVFGTRVARDAYNQELKREEQRAAARQARAERKAAKAAKAANEAADEADAVAAEDDAEASG